MQEIGDFRLSISCILYTSLSIFEKVMNMCVMCTCIVFCQVNTSNNEN